MRKKLVFVSMICIVLALLMAMAPIAALAGSGPCGTCGNDSGNGDMYNRGNGSGDMNGPPCSGLECP